jgi:hypothetical protein
LDINETIPDLTLRRPDGAAVRFSELVTAPTLLIFLRHLA